MTREDDALASFEKAVSLDPDVPEALTNCAHLRWTCKGDYAGAARDLARSTR